MGQLTNLYVSQSYQGLIKLTDSTTGVTGTLQYLQDGLGNRLPIQMSTSSVSITGSLFGTASFASNTVSSSYSDFALSSSYASNATSASYALNATSASFATNAATASIANDLIVRGKNNNPSTLTRGTIVRISGADGNNPLFDTASWINDANSANTLGMLSEDVTANGFANVVVQGKVEGINTNGMTPGAMLYLSSSGQYTTVIPPAPYHEVRLGQVLRVNTNQGSAYVSIDNGYELTELHDVDITNPVVGDLLVYTSGSYGIWENKTASQIGLATTSSLTSLSSSIASTDLGQNNRLTSIEQKTGSYATTGSNIFNGSQNILGSLQVRDNVSITGSLLVDRITNESSTILQIEPNTQLILGNTVTTSSLYGQLELNNSKVVVNTGDITGTTNQINLNTAGVSITGSVDIQGNITAQSASFTYLETIYQTSSVLFSSGSNILGDEASDVQTLYGTVRLPNGPLDITGSLRTSGQIRTDNSLIAIGGVQTNNISNPGTAGDITINSNTSKIILEGNTEVTGTLKVTNGITGSLEGTASYATNALSASQAQNSVSASQSTNANTASYVLNAVSSSYATNALSASYAPDTTNTGSLVQTVGLLSPTDDTVQVIKGDGTINTFTINNVQSASFATNALSASYAPTVLPAGTVSGSAQIVELGFATTSSVNQKLDTGSFNTYSGDTLNLINTKLDTGSFNSYTSSNDGKVNDLISKTGSYVTEAESGSFMTTGSVAGNVLTFTKGDGTTFNLTVNTGSGGGTIDTGSFAITGSNRFNGNQIITGSVNVSGSVNISGSAYFKKVSNTGIDYISEGFDTAGNIYFGSNGLFNTNSGSFIITGSNNLVTSQFPLTVGYNNVINGHGNIMLGSTGVLLSTSSIPVVTSANIGGGSMTINFGTSSLAAPVVGNNQILGGATFTSPSGSINAINNAFIGSVVYRATGSTHNTLSTMTNNIFNSTPAFNAVSSSIAMTYNTFGGGTTTINNNYTSSNTSGNQLAVNRNAIFGQNHTINISGSNDGSTNFRAVNDNLIAGIANIVNASAVGTTSGSLTQAMILGANLTVSASNRAGGNDVGSVFLGRNNDTAQGLSESTTTVLAVGTGTSTAAKRTSLHVSSSGLFQVRHNMIVSGSMTVTGSAVITGSVQGNVLPLTVTSNTASLNLNNGNFFELALTGSQDIRIEPSNIKPGQTVNIKLNTTGSGTVSFPTTVKQVSGSSYTPTTAVSTDIITMVSFDSTNLYLANVKNLV